MVMQTSASRERSARFYIGVHRSTQARVVARVVTKMPYRNEDDARRLRREAEATKVVPAIVAWRPSSATWAALFATMLTLIAVGAGLSTSQRNAAGEPTPSLAPPAASEPASATDPTLSWLRRHADALGVREIESGTRTAHVVTDTLFHLAAGAECEVHTRTQAGACAVSVRCDGRTLYSADEAHGLTCIQGLVGASAVFDRGTTSMDGTPALVVTREEVELVDNAATQRGILRLAYSPLAEPT